MHRRGAERAVASASLRLTCLTGVVAFGMRRIILITTTLLFIAGAVLAAASPEATISNKQLRIKMYLPDPENGFYKGARFDWSGIINRVEFAGHTFYGQWFSKIDPTVRDVSYKDNDILVSVNTSAMGPGTGGGISDTSGLRQSQRRREIHQDRCWSTAEKGRDSLRIRECLRHCGPRKMDGESDRELCRVHAGT